MTGGLDEGAALKLVRGLHDIATEEDFLARFVNDYPEKLGATALHTFVFSNIQEPLFSACTDALIPVAADYFPYAATDPRVMYAERHVGRLHSCVDIAPIDEMERLPLVNEFLEGLGIRWTMGGEFPLPDGAKGIVGLMRPRSRGAFVDEARQPADLVFPHFAELARTRLAVSQARLWQATLEDALDSDERPVVVLTGDSRIVYANRASEALFRQGDIFRARTGYIGMAAEGQAGELRKLVAAKAAARDTTATSPSLLPVRDAGGELTHVIRLWLLPVQTGPLGRIGPFVQLTVESLSRDVRLAPEAKQLLGLSRREFEMAEALCSRETTAEAADRLGISHETARGYVKTLLGKLGAASQKDALRVLMRLALQRDPEPGRSQ